MATFKICVFEHQKRSDGKFKVSIRVCWKRQYAYIGTEYYVTAKQINLKNYTLKDVFIINELNQRIASYEDLKVKKLGKRIDVFTAKELAKYFVDETKHGSDDTIDFVEFSRKHITKLLLQGRRSTGNGMAGTINLLIDFCNGREKIAITEITAKFLAQFEIYLRSERTMKRRDRYGRMVNIKRPGLSDVSVIDYMTNIRTLFNAAMEEYNDEDKDMIRILHYPFRKYKLKQRPESRKRNLTIEEIARIRDIPDEKMIHERARFARDIFMLSFYLVGINLIDLYEIDKYKGGRLIYERMKTKGRRKDRAFISIKVEPEAVELVEKYRDKTGERIFDFYKRYYISPNFGNNVNRGLKEFAKACKITEPLSTYYARHSWATIARNKCGISKDDVDLALNHIDQGRKMADVYIEKDWSMIDRANRAVIDLLNSVATD